MDIKNRKSIRHMQTLTDDHGKVDRGIWWIKMMKQIMSWENRGWKTADNFYGIVGGSIFMVKLQNRYITWN